MPWQADSSGKVTVGTKLARGQKVDVGQGRHEICAFLTPLKTGKEGEAIAAAARQKTGAGQVIDAEAAKLSGDLEKEIKSAMAARDQFTGQMKIAYLVTPTRGLLAIRESTEFQSRHFQIACTLTPDQDKFFATLSEGDMVKLQGTVDKIDGRSMELRDCRQAN